MNEKTINWQDLQLFLAVAQAGGLSAAAQRTGRSPATLGRRMLALEQAVARDLFIRQDRGYDLTDGGRALLQGLVAIDARLEALTRPPQAASTPLVKISAGSWTTLALMRRLKDITGDPPDIRPRFISAEAVLDMPHREVVIGLRNQRPTQRNLAGRKLARVEFAPYAAEGAPRLWIRVLADTPSARWVDERCGDAVACDVNTPRNSLDLALAGCGTALLPTFVGDAQSALRRVGETIDALAHHQWLVTHQDDRYQPAIRRAINRIRSVLMDTSP